MKLWSEKFKMIREDQIRGSLDTVFYAEKSLDRSLIYKFEFHQNSSRKLTKNLVYELNSRLVAMDYDSNSDSFKTNRPSLFLLGEDQKLHLIKNCKENEDSYEVSDVFDFGKHKME